MATITASSISSSDSLERFRQEFNTLRSDVSNINSAAISITNESNNRILTSVSTNTLNAEESLTFDGSTFSVGGAVTVTGLTTLSGNLVIPNGGNIGSAGDTDAIAISTDGTVTFSSDVTLTGDSANAVWDKSDNALEFADNAKVFFGNAADLQIYHDGSNSYIKDAGIGYLILGGQSTGTAIHNGSGQNLLITSANDIKLAYAGTNKLATTSAGISVTGTATMSGNVVIADAGNIGSASDTDAIAIASNGVVTFSQAPVFPDGSINIADIDLDGGTDIGAAIDDADLFLIDDGAGGTMRKTAASRLKTYIGAGAADDLTAGDAAVNITTTSGNITIDAQANDSDIILKGTDGGVDTTFLTIDGSAAGEATFNAGIVIADAGNIGSASDKDAIAIASDGVVTMNQIPVFSAGINVSGGTIAGTLATAAQTNITSLGTLTGLTISGDVTFTGASYNVVWDKSDNALEFADNAKAVFGAGSDLQIYHDGSNSVIADSGTGVLDIKSDGAAIQLSTNTGELFAYFSRDADAQLYYDNSKKLETTSGGINVTGTVTDDGATHDGDVTFTGDSYNAVWDKSDNRLEFADNAQAAFGAGSDLRIYHNGSNSYIDESGTGALIFKSNIYSFRNAADNETIALFTENGSVDLYYDNSKKLETTSAGIDVTGSIATDGAGLDGAVVINESSADVDFRVESNGNANMLFVDAGNDRVGIGTNAPGQPLEIFSNTAEVSLNSSSSTYSRFVHKHNGTAMWTTGTRGDGDYHIYRESGSGNVVIGSGGSLDVGGNDTGGAGLLNVYGGTSGEGGEIRIFPSAGEDTTINFWSLDCAADDLRIFSSVGDLAIVAQANGSTDLYHDGSGKLSTSSGGIVVTGTVSATAGSTLLIVNSSGTTLKTIKGMS